MNYKDEINELHKKGFVILRASITTNAPKGWKRVNGKIKYGYAEEMADPELRVYRSSFNAEILSKSHCGFYLGHGGLCCIDLDTKKITLEQTTKVKNLILKQLKSKVAVEFTKSKGWHIYFRYQNQLPNESDWTGLGAKNWIELYHSKRFIACYLSNSKTYVLEHGNILKLPLLTKKEYSQLLTPLLPYKKKQGTIKKRKTSTLEVDKETWDEAENYIKQIEDKGLDITGNEPTWFKIGKAFANAFGSKGFDMFNRVSQFSPLYNEDTIQNVYQRYVDDDGKRNGEKITIATFFKMCSDNGLLDFRTLKTLKERPEIPKEYDIVISKKTKSVAERCHIVVTEFRREVKICCLDNINFYVFHTTHWVRQNAREILGLIDNFLYRSTINPEYIHLFQTVPYMEMMLKELRMITQRDSIQPHTGSLEEGVFINMGNGILHIKPNGKRVLLEHNHTYNFTTVLPYNYDVMISCPKFDTWMDTQIPDKALQEVYYAFVASCLTKHKADIIMLLAGETSTGKSSLIDVTRRIIGIENSAAISAGTLFGGGHEAPAIAMRMENKLLAYDFDAQPFTKLEMLLKVAAQEPLEGWQMNIARRDVVNYGRLIIAMNPFNYGVFDKAVARRLITINMDIPVIKDNAVMPAIYKEMAGIFNHVLNIGLLHLIKNGGQIKQTEAMRQATIDLHMRPKDSIRFFEEFYIMLKPSTDSSKRKTALQKLKEMNPGVTIVHTNVTYLYAAFRGWMITTEGHPEYKVLLRKYFVTDLKNYGIEEGVVKDEKKEVRRGIFIGLVLDEKGAPKDTVLGAEKL